MSQQLGDIIWVAVSAALVFLMQGGFLCLESGLTRSKNSINVAVKNLTDFGVAVLLYWIAGFAVMFGSSYNGWFGYNTSDLFVALDQDLWKATFFLFQVMFVATAATIVSGAVAERMNFSSYIFITAVISGVIYPVFGHWAWGSFFYGETAGWLEEIGFVDFAGSTVVHSVGGWVALAAVIVIGPRTGRFPKGAPPRDIPGHDMPMAMLGAIILLFGWFGFNGGSTLALNEDIPRILTNTVIAAAAGMVSSLLFGWIFRRLPGVSLIINGLLAGLVAITANCHAVSSSSAVIIGAVGGIVSLTIEWLLIKCRIDDVIGAVPVHLGAGIWGTIAVALFGRPEALGTDLTMLQQLIVQLKGIGAAGLWCFVLSFILLWIWNKLTPLRVTSEAEHMGLNVAEHGASTELIDLFYAMEQQESTGDLSIRMPVEPFTEVGQIASRYNQVMDSLMTAIREREELINSDILKNVKEGLCLIDPQGTISPQYSRAMEEIVQREDLGNQGFLGTLENIISPEQLEETRGYMKLLFNPAMDEAMIRNINPLQSVELRRVSQDSNRLTLKPRYIQFRFSRIMEKGRVSYVLVAAHDVTSEVQLKRQIEAQEEETRNKLQLLFNILHISPPLLHDFLPGFNEEIQKIQKVLQEDTAPDKNRSKLDFIYRSVHSIKGNASLLDLKLVTERAHHFENSIEEVRAKETISGQDFLGLAIQLNDLIEISKQLGDLVQRLATFQHTFHGDVEQPSRARSLLQSLAKRAETSGKSLGKDVEIVHQGFHYESIPTRYQKVIEDVLIQMVLNAVYHGLETPQERSARAKNPIGRIEIETATRGTDFIVRIRDDGRGIQVDRLKDRVLSTGKYNESEVAGWTSGKLASLIFMPGVSTADTADEGAGRGVGMDMVRNKIKGLGGTIRATFKNGEFCEFQITLPP